MNTGQYRMPRLRRWSWRSSWSSDTSSAPSHSCSFSCTPPGANPTRASVSSSNFLPRKEWAGQHSAFALARYNESMTLQTLPQKFRLSSSGVELPALPFPAPLKGLDAPSSGNKVYLFAQRILALQNAFRGTPVNNNFTSFLWQMRQKKLGPCNRDDCCFIGQKSH